MRASATRRHRPLLDAINSGKVRAFANGGPVAPSNAISANHYQAVSAAVIAVQATPAQAAAPQPAVLQVIDQRKNGGTIKTQESRGPKGARVLKAYILDTVKEGVKYGSRGF